MSAADTPTPDEHSETSEKPIDPSEKLTEPHEPPRAYAYPHSTDHPPVAPVPDDGEHEVKSYGGAPEGGT